MGHPMNVNNANYVADELRRNRVRQEERRKKWLKTEERKPDYKVFSEKMRIHTVYALKRKEKVKTSFEELRHKISRADHGTKRELASRNLNKMANFINFIDIDILFFRRLRGRLIKGQKIEAVRSIDEYLKVLESELKIYSELYNEISYFI
jgi:hypothetical protein